MKRCQYAEPVCEGQVTLDESIAAALGAGREEAL